MKTLSIQTIGYCILLLGILLLVGCKTTTHVSSLAKTQAKMPTLSTKTIADIRQEIGIDPAYVIAVGKNDKIGPAMSPDYENVATAYPARSIDKITSISLVDFDKTRSDNLAGKDNCRQIFLDDDTADDTRQKQTLCQQPMQERDVSQHTSENDIPMMSPGLILQIQKDTRIRNATLLITFDKAGNYVLARNPGYAIENNLDRGKRNKPNKDITDVTAITITSFTKNPTCVWMSTGGRYFLYCFKV